MPRLLANTTDYPRLVAKGLGTRPQAKPADLVLRPNRAFGLGANFGSEGRIGQAEEPGVPLYPNCGDLGTLRLCQYGMGLLAEQS
jgi:hypothetical protein